MPRWAYLMVGLLVLAPWASTLAETPAAFDFTEQRLVLNGVETVIARKAEAICPPNCILPIIAADGVATLGAQEVIEFLGNDVAAGQGIVLDIRLPKAFAAGHLPGAVNVPAMTLAADNPAQAAILQALGAKAAVWVVYGDGPQDRDAVQAVQEVVAAGVPTDGLRYFRGGMQEWLTLGLTVSNTVSGG